ncbi:General odorant-binding protein 84a [Pseudolycoriella hygida]|uniref:General odorant-binding protein 84a n=1 Tax=Pseudolycoriella hygida TaxID=35572 RepID=A0A9Q0MQG1_9DIPT|nr:General odorant-binding protein 84a [Pseudolycoriella hygida]
MDRHKMILVSMVVHCYSCVNSMDSNNSMLSSHNNNSPAMLQSNVSNNGKSDTVSSVVQVDAGEHDLNQIVQMCNETYRIPINYLEEMNMTGSYPDETEKLPMCFMKCYLEKVGVMSSENVIDMKAATQHFSTNEDLINSCLMEQSEIDSLDPCEYAYFLARCITMATLVDNRKEHT